MSTHRLITEIIHVGRDLRGSYDQVIFSDVDGGRRYVDQTKVDKSGSTPGSFPCVTARTTGQAPGLRLRPPSECRRHLSLRTPRDEGGLGRRGTDVPHPR